MHFYFEQQQNKVSEMKNARVSAVNVEAVEEQANNKLEQDKVSVVTEKEKLADTKVNKNFKAVAKKVNIRKQGKRAVKVVIEKGEITLERATANVGNVAKQRKVELN